MNLVSIRIITENFEELVSFYEGMSGLAATRYTEDFAELATPGCMLAIGSTRTITFFGPNVARQATNRSVIIEFIVHDVDDKFERLRAMIDEFVQEPTTMPWGNRSLLFRDPDGNLINYFSPGTPEALKEFMG